jgi:hypothetical protein
MEKVCEAVTGIPGQVLGWGDKYSADKYWGCGKHVEKPKI